MTHRLPPSQMPFDLSDKKVRDDLLYLMDSTGYSAQSLLEYAVLHLTAICEHAWHVYPVQLPTDRIPVIQSITFKEPGTGSDPNTSE